MKTPNTPRKRLHRRLGASLRAGFSLVELLIVIAVIGIIAAIAIPNISGVSDAAKQSTAQRNAQNIASVYNSAITAGATSTATDADTAADAVIAGMTPASGPFATKEFKVPNIDTTAKGYAVQFLTLNNGVLEYNANAAFQP
jgi:type IV pilus assembly protein PilA